MTDLPLLEGVVAECLGLMFADIATHTCLAGLQMPASALQGDTPSA